MNEINILYIDLFCGAGGTSTGVQSARVAGKKCAKVIACVNHDANAITSHAANHPHTLHFTEDIRTLDLSSLLSHTKESRKQHPKALVVLWASLECTNFSKAKGGQPRDADSRTLAEHLFRYIEAIDPDYIQIENVEEFMSWGPMDENGKPISMQRGEDYTRWVRSVKSYGYNFDHRILNAADFGAYTSRKRFFGIFAKKGLPIAWPSPTHCKEGKRDMFGSFEKWKPVKEVLDFEDEGTSIFTRKKPLAEKTLERIYAGLIKFVAGGKTGKNVPPDIDQPCPKVRCRFMSKYFSGHPESKNIPVTGPAHTIKCKDNHSLVNAKFLSAYYGNGHNHSISNPSPTVTTKDRFGYVSPRFPDMQYGNGTPPDFVKIDSLGNVFIEVYEDDSPMIRKIKEFMVIYGIIDILMRMLKILELLRIMGFPQEYKLIGTQADQKKFIGNAVEVTMSRVLCEALAKRLMELKVAV